MAVKATEVDLLGVQTCQSLTDLSVCAHVFGEDGVDDLLRSVISVLAAK